MRGRARDRPNWLPARAGNALVHGALFAAGLAAGPNRRCAGPPWLGMCGGAGPRETVLGVPQ